MEASRQNNGDGGELGETGPHLFDSYVEATDAVPPDDNEAQPVLADQPKPAAEEQSKIFVSDINRYPLLSDFEVIQLAKRVEKGDPEAKKRLVESNLGLVVNIAKRYPENSFTLLDNIQEGVLGLIRAVEKFDWRRGIKFSTYADYWIREAIGRGTDNKARTIRIPVGWEADLRKTWRAERDLTQELGRNPNEDEIAAQTNLPVERVRQVKTAAQPVDSLNGSIAENSELEVGYFFADEQESDPVEIVDTNFRLEMLERALGELPASLRRVIKDRYGIGAGNLEPRTLDQIAAAEDIPPWQVSQIQATALAALAKSPRAQSARDDDKEYIKDEPVKHSSGES